ncbi:MAG: hypothetical protein FJW97_11110 [Actinobacteria bacterium]|nr:hypothetical protein [Actinomycetota bacterium]
MGDLIRLIAIDVLVVIVVSLAVGVSAPRWPGSWLTRDRLVLHRFPWETPTYFRRFPIATWARVLPEWGATFGGQSKRSIPDRDPLAIAAYLTELRRAEWVHWVSMFSWVPLAFFNPWWLTVAFAIIVVLGNAPFMMILRSNRMRMTSILARLEKE